VYVTLKDWKSGRTRRSTCSADRADERRFAGITEARVFAMNEPPISGMGNIAGFDFRLMALDGDGRS